MIKSTLAAFAVLSSALLCIYLLARPRDKRKQDYAGVRSGLSARLHGWSNNLKSYAAGLKHTDRSEADLKGTGAAAA